MLLGQEDASKEQKINLSFCEQADNDIKKNNINWLCYRDKRRRERNGKLSYLFVNINSVILCTKWKFA